ncbi:hypothetical protein C943_00153 [Mariniradius saccharolyticus AK6]|uniref:Uncharacterized protein n=1 Tax=Mariniradius saccharolyticus AK6 TaxID=1239962 RepID=M7XD80_9BACT|nr:hypothetical protein C943_00153 [Mariniradius saccharolyticus AK6]
MLMDLLLLLPAKAVIFILIYLKMEKLIFSGWTEIYPE